VSRPWAWVAALAAAACAGAPARARHDFAFPDSFDVNQVVTARVEGVAQELVASLRRRGAEYEVTLFDPAFGVPLLSASLAGGSVTIASAAGPLRRDDAERLLAMLGDLYAQRFRARGPDRLEAKSGRFVYRLAGLRSREGCAFPDRIDVAPRMGSAVVIEVVTLDVSCPGGDRSR
jgi:hypothetical protein